MKMIQWDSSSEISAIGQSNLVKCNGTVSFSDDRIFSRDSKRSSK
jgi:hypothetical protein